MPTGSCSIEFSGAVLGDNTPDLDFGVGKTEASTFATYLTKVTPAGAVPEASTWAMMTLGLAGVGGLTVRRRSEAQTRP